MSSMRTPIDRRRGVEYTSGSGNFTVPDNVYEIEYEIVGGGAGGGSGGFDSNAANTAGGGGSGAPGVYERGRMKVIPGEVIPYVVGAKGNGGAAVSSSGAGNAGADGGYSSLGGIVAFGGKGLWCGGQRIGSASTSSGGAAGTTPIAISSLYFDGPGRDAGAINHFQVFGKTIYSDPWRTIVAALGIAGYKSDGSGTATEQYGPATSGGNATRAGGGGAGVSTPVGIGGNGSAGVNSGASSAGGNATGYGASGGGSGGCSGGTGSGKGGDGAGGRVRVWWEV